MNYSDKTKAGLLLAICSVQFFVLLMMAESMAPDYSMHDNAISDLGTIGETAVLFNMSLLLVGILTITGGFFFYRFHGERRLLILFIIAGIGAIGTGLFTLDNPNGLHGIFALIAFVFFNLMAISSAKLFSSPMKELSFTFGAIGIVFVFVMFVSDAEIIDLFGPIGHGGTERMIVYPPIMWLAILGGYLLASGPEKKSNAGETV